MECIRTAKLKLHTTPAQIHDLRATQLAYRDALNYVSRYAFAHGKMSNKVGLQEGARSATRRLVVVSGRERRFQHERNHRISRRIVDAYPHRLIGLEEFTHIRERRKRTHGKRATHQQRRANRHASQWAFAELQAYIAYKALAVGSVTIKVDACKTSQACPRCGHTAEDHRPRQGLLFVCQVRQLILHADLIGARNVALRTLLARQDWVSTGVLSERPAVSVEEAKAARRRR